jgi:repressor LexA
LYNKYEELLKQTGKTSYQVSKDTGIGENTLSQWKSGSSKPKVDKLQILANYFGVPVNYFLEK